MKKIAITGAAGFIGFHLVKALRALNYDVVAFDNFNDYYDPLLKKARCEQLDIQVEKIDLIDKDALEDFLKAHRPDIVINLAAQAGVRYCMTHPDAYVDSNLRGFVNLLEAMRTVGISRLIYASSSSVYGNQEVPFRENASTDRPLNLYGATKKANETIAYAYHHAWHMECIGLRFFTVYGPWGRPDMAYYTFTKALYEGSPITLYNSGLMERDFTYIDDIVAGIVGALAFPLPFALFNLGGHVTTTVRDFLGILEEATGKKAHIVHHPLDRAEMVRTWAEIESAHKYLGFTPKIALKEGLTRFVNWYKEWHCT